MAGTSYPSVPNVPLDDRRKKKPQLGPAWTPNVTIIPGVPKGGTPLAGIAERAAIKGVKR